MPAGPEAISSPVIFRCVVCVSYSSLRHFLRDCLAAEKCDERMKRVMSFAGIYTRNTKRQNYPSPVLGSWPFPNFLILKNNEMEGQNK